MSITTITYKLNHQQYIGLDKLRFWCMDKKKKSNSRKETRMWSGRIGFIGRVTSRGEYNDSDKEQLNYLREQYIIESL
jgi:hypothetical protein